MDPSLDQVCSGQVAGEGSEYGWAVVVVHEADGAPLLRLGARVMPWRLHDAVRACPDVLLDASGQAIAAPFVVRSVDAAKMRLDVLAEQAEDLRDDLTSGDARGAFEEFGGVRNILRVLSRAAGAWDVVFHAEGFRYRMVVADGRVVRVSMPGENTGAADLVELVLRARVGEVAIASTEAAAEGPRLGNVLEALHEQLVREAGAAGEEDASDTQALDADAVRELAERMRRDAERAAAEKRKAIGAALDALEAEAPDPEAHAPEPTKLEKRVPLPAKLPSAPPPPMPAALARPRRAPPSSKEVPKIRDAEAFEDEDEATIVADEHNKDLREKALAAIEARHRAARAATPEDADAKLREEVAEARRRQAEARAREREEEAARAREKAEEAAPTEGEAALERPEEPSAPPATPPPREAAPASPVAAPSPPPPEPMAEAPARSGLRPGEWVLLVLLFAAVAGGAFFAVTQLF